MKSFAVSFCVVAMSFSFAAVGCGGDASNRTVTVDVGNDQTVRTEVSRELPNGGSEQAVSVAVWRYDEQVAVQLTPAEGCRIGCASVCVGRLSGSPDECRPWIRAAYGPGGSFTANIPGYVSETRICAVTYHVHIRLRGMVCNADQ